MSHAPFRDRLVALSGSTAQDPGGFLEGLSSIHDDWHTEFSRGYGFLLFHNRVVRAFKAILGPAVDPPIEPFTDQQFQEMQVQPFQADLAGVDTLGGWSGSPTSIESWHNTAHMGIGMATGRIRTSS